jgi:hypothetical protein
MLDAIGAPDIAALFAQIPAAHRLKAPLDPPHARDNAGVPACRLGNLAAKA